MNNNIQLNSKESKHGEQGVVEKAEGVGSTDIDPSSAIRKSNLTKYGIQNESDTDQNKLFSEVDENKISDINEEVDHLDESRSKDTFHTAENTMHDARVISDEDVQTIVSAVHEKSPEPFHPRPANVYKETSTPHDQNMEVISEGDDEELLVIDMEELPNDSIQSTTTSLPSSSTTAELAVTNVTTSTSGVSKLPAKISNQNESQKLSNNLSTTPITQPAIDPNILRTEMMKLLPELLKQMTGSSGNLPNILSVSSTNTTPSTKTTPKQETSTISLPRSTDTFHNVLHEAHIEDEPVILPNQNKPKKTNISSNAHSTLPQRQTQMTKNLLSPPTTRHIVKGQSLPTYTNTSRSSSTHQLDKKPISNRYPVKNNATGQQPTNVNYIDKRNMLTVQEPTRFRLKNIDLGVTSPLVTQNRPPPRIQNNPPPGTQNNPPPLTQNNPPPLKIINRMMKENFAVQNNKPLVINKAFQLKQPVTYLTTETPALQAVQFPTAIKSDLPNQQTHPKQIFQLSPVTPTPTDFMVPADVLDVIRSGKVVSNMLFPVFNTNGTKIYLSSEQILSKLNRPTVSTQPQLSNLITTVTVTQGVHNSVPDTTPKQITSNFSAPKAGKAAIDPETVTKLYLQHHEKEHLEYIKNSLQLNKTVDKCELQFNNITYSHEENGEQMYKVEWVTHTWEKETDILNSDLKEKLLTWKLKESVPIKSSNADNVPVKSTRKTRKNKKDVLKDKSDHSLVKSPPKVRKNKKDVLKDEPVQDDPQMTTPNTVVERSAEKVTEIAQQPLVTDIAQPDIVNECNNDLKNKENSLNKSMEVTESINESDASIAESKKNCVIESIVSESMEQIEPIHKTIDTIAESKDTPPSVSTELNLSMDESNGTSTTNAIKVGSSGKIVDTESDRKKLVEDIMKQYTKLSPVLTSPSSISGSKATYKEFDFVGMLSKEKKIITNVSEPKGKKSHCCKHCRKKFTQADLLKHNRVYKKFTCPQCKIRICDRRKLRKHVVQHSKESYQCPHCYKVFYSDSIYTSHMNDKHPFTDGVEKKKNYKKYNCICKKEFSKITQFKKHKLFHKITKASEQSQCQICRKTFSSITRLNHHLQMHQVSYRECSTCEECFDVDDIDTSHTCTGVPNIQNVSNFDAILKKIEPKHKFDNTLKYGTHLIQRKYSKWRTKKKCLCVRCVKGFKNRDSFYEHVNLSDCPNLKDNGQCMLCKQYFSSLDQLKVHVTSCFKDSLTSLLRPKSRSDDESDSQSKRLVYQCTKCVALFPSSEVLQTHKKFFHVKSEKKYRCVTCGFECVSKRWMCKHLKSKLCPIVNNFSCFMCDQNRVQYAAFPTLLTLLAHLTSHQLKPTTKEFQRIPTSVQHCENKTIVEDPEIKPATITNENGKTLLLSLTKDEAANLNGKSVLCDVPDFGWYEVTINNSETPSCYSAKLFDLDKHIDTLKKSTNSKSQVRTVSSTENIHCFDCNKCFTSKRSIMQHFKSDHEWRFIQLVVCVHCSTAFRERKSYEEHVKECNLKPKEKTSKQTKILEVPPTQNKVPPNDSTLQNNVPTTPPGNMATTAKQAAKEIAGGKLVFPILLDEKCTCAACVNKNKNGKYFCTKCKLLTFCKKTYTKHTSTDHEYPCVYVCVTCNGMFYTVGEFNIHIEKCSNKTCIFTIIRIEWPCYICLQKIPVDDLSKHVMSHAQSMLECYLCTVKTPTLQLLKSHLLNVHKTPWSSKEAQWCKKITNGLVILKNLCNRNSTQKDNIARCKTCKATFFSRETLCLHESSLCCKKEKTKVLTNIVSTPVMIPSKTVSATKTDAVTKVATTPKLTTKNDREAVSLRQTKSKYPSKEIIIPRYFPYKVVELFTKKKNIFHCKLCFSVFDSDIDVKNHVSGNHLHHTPPAAVNDLQLNLYESSSTNISFEKGKVQSQLITHHCNQCELKFTDSTSCWKHVFSHLNLNVFHCSLCQMSFAFEEELHFHYFFHKCLVCWLCHKTFHTIDELMKHSQLHVLEVNIPRDENGKIVIEIEDQEDWEQDSKKLFPNQDEKQPRFVVTSKILPSILEDTRLFYCRVCKKNIEGELTYIIHIKTHSSARRFFCLICQKTCSDKSRFEEHFQKHFSQPKHLKLNVDDNIEKEVDMEDDDDGDEEPLKCNLCLQVFENEKEKQTHEDRYRTSVYKIADMREAIVITSHVQKYCVSMSIDEKHEDSEWLLANNEDLKKIYLSLEYAQKVKKSIVVNEKSCDSFLCCLFCQIWFDSANDKLKHMETHFWHEDMVKCSFCSIVAHPLDLLDHTVCVHNEKIEPGFSTCPICHVVLNDQIQLVGDNPPRCLTVLNHLKRHYIQYKVALDNRGMFFTFKGKVNCAYCFELLPSSSLFEHMKKHSKNSNPSKVPYTFINRIISEENSEGLDVTSTKKEKNNNQKQAVKALLDASDVKQNIKQNKSSKKINVMESKSNVDFEVKSHAEIKRKTTGNVIKDESASMLSHEERYVNTMMMGLSSPICPVCQWVFNTFGDLNDHLIKHAKHSEVFINPSIAVCIFCNDVFKKNMMNSHVAKKHPLEVALHARKSQTKEKDIQKQKHDLSKATVVDFIETKCPVCSWIFPSNEQLENHIERHIQHMPSNCDDRDVGCALCTMTLRKTSLTAHLMRRHSKELKLHEKLLKEGKDIHFDVRILAIKKTDDDKKLSTKKVVKDNKSNKTIVTKDVSTNPIVENNVSTHPNIEKSESRKTSEQAVSVEENLQTVAPPPKVVRDFDYSKLNSMPYPETCMYCFKGFYTRNQRLNHVKVSHPWLYQDEMKKCEEEKQKKETERKEQKEQKEKNELKRKSTIDKVVGTKKSKIEKQSISEKIEKKLKASSKMKSATISPSKPRKIIRPGQPPISFSNANQKTSKQLPPNDASETTKKKTNLETEIVAFDESLITTNDGKKIQKQVSTEDEDDIIEETDEEILISSSDEEEKKVTETTISSPGKYPCPHCKLALPSPTELATHISVHQPTSQQDKYFSVPYPYICVYCGVGYYQTSSLKQHLQGKHKLLYKPDLEKDATFINKAIGLDVDYEKGQSITSTFQLPKRDRSKFKSVLAHLRKGTSIVDHSPGTTGESKNKSDNRKRISGKQGKAVQKKKQKESTEKMTTKSKTIIQEDSSDSSSSEEESESEIEEETEEESIEDSESESPEREDSSEDSSTESASTDSDSDTESTYEKSSKRENYVCQLCDWIISSAQALKEHFKEHRSKAKTSHITCVQCKALIQRHDMKWHMHTKHANNPDIKLIGDKLYCPKCNFSDKRSIEDHLKEEHPEMLTVECRLCDSRFSTQEYYQHHFNDTHGKTINEETLECFLCNKTFTSLSRLHCHYSIVHMKKDEKLYCALCSKFFYTQLDLDKHKDDYHKNDMFQCGLCLKEFYEAKQCETHVQNHKVKTLHVCKQCKFYFESSEMLEKHLTTHNQQNLYCTQCSESFNDMVEYEGHKLKHSQSSSKEDSMQRSYSCNVCEKTFHDFIATQTHMNEVHHGGAPTPSKLTDVGEHVSGGHYLTLNKCEVCKEEFLREDIYNEHMKKHSK